MYVYNTYQWIYNCTKFGKIRINPNYVIFVLQNAKYYCEDISEGKERTPVSCINELLNQSPPKFSYCTDRVCGDDVTINTDQSFLIGCNCTDGCRVSQTLSVS